MAVNSRPSAASCHDWAACGSANSDLGGFGGTQSLAALPLSMLERAG
jgi:hypothetical protein